MEHLTQWSMKALTVWQPWASLIIIGAKPWEFRHRSYFAYINPPHTGERIAVHAASRPARLTEVDGILARILSGNAPDLITDRAGAFLEPLRTALRQPRGGGTSTARDIAPLGCVLGTAIIGEPKRADNLFDRQPDFEDEDFNWGWPLTDIDKFVAPVPARGMQGFWRWKS